jgi:hypothetical protein
MHRRHKVKNTPHDHQVFNFVLCYGLKITPAAITKKPLFRGVKKCLINTRKTPKKYPIYLNKTALNTLIYGFYLL